VLPPVKIYAEIRLHNSNWGQSIFDRITLLKISLVSQDKPN